MLVGGCLIANWVLSGRPGALAQSRQFVREVSIDRSGNDFRSDLLAPEAGVDGCEQLCRAAAGCVAYTFVKRSTTVPQPVCWLKDKLPHGYDSSCCISGALKN